MKKVLLSSALFLISFIGFSQTKGISYQAVIIDPNPIEIPGKDITAQPYVSKDVWIRFGIYAGTTLQYEELHKTKTDEFGLVNLVIGAGVNTGKAGTFTSLNWDGITKSIVTNVSFDQGGRYTEVSNQKLNYVPYTLLAETAVKLSGVLPIASGGTGATNAIAARTNLGLGNVDNTADADKPVSIATLAILDTKEAIANKSTNIIADSASSVKYPSVKAIKDYVDSRTSSANNANLAAKASALETPRTINGVPFDGTANITIPVGVTPPDANATTKGLVQLAGDLTGTAAAPTIAAGAVTTAKIADGAVTTSKLAMGAVNAPQIAPGSVTDVKITSVSGSKVIGNIAGNAATATLATTANSANTATKLTTARTINGTPFDGTSDISIIANASTLSGTVALANGGTGASTAAGARSNLGLVIGTDVLAQRTFGTAANSAATDFVAATEKGANNGVATLGVNGKIPSTQIPAISFQNVSVVNSDATMAAISGAQVGSIAIRTDNNNNYVLSALPASTLSNWIALATPIYVSTINGIAGPNVNLTTNEITEGTTNKYYTDARVRNAISATAPLSYNASTGNFSLTAASASANGYLSSADWTTFNNKQTALTAGVDYATPSGNITGNAANVTGIVSIANGGTGTSTATGALLTLGAEPSANKSNDILVDGNSTTKFPTFKVIKDYVDQQSANAGVADNSITSAKINGTLAVLKGGTGASTAAGARTNLGLVIGTDVMAANATTALTGDVTGSGNGSFATTVNSVGGVSSSTIATLPTTVASHTASITANATAIATNTASIATNATAITTEATTARAAELTLTNSVNANTASITANTNSIATLNTNVAANTASITANSADIASLTNSLSTNAVPYTGATQAVNLGTYSLTTGSVNGILVGSGNNVGINNTIVGKSAGGLTSLDGITAVGAFAQNAGSGGNSTSIGAYAGANNTGGYNTNVGFGASRYQVSSQYNTVIGNEAFQGRASAPYSDNFSMYNVAIGDKAMKSHKTGAGNVAVGYLSFMGDPTLGSIGEENTSVGMTSLRNNNTGSRNVALGAYAGYYETGSDAFYVNNRDRGSAGNDRTKSLLYGKFDADPSLQTLAINANVTIPYSLDVTGNITSGTWSGSTIAIAKGGTGATNAAAARANLGLVIGTDVMAGNATTTLTGDVTGAGNGSFATTLAASGVTSGTYGSSTAIPVLTVDTKGRVTSASTVGITAGVSTLAYSATAAANGGTISGTTLTLAAANGSNPGLVSTGAQTFAGAKTFSSDATISGITVGVGTGSQASNAVLGKSAMTNNTTGFNTVAVGFEALKANIFSNYNTAVGSTALSSNNNADANTAVGFAALTASQSGGYNTAVGSNSLAANTSGSLNTGLGNTALYTNTTGSNNTGVGNAALISNTTGSNNTAIGYGADVASGALTNATAIGNGAVVSASNRIQLGNANVTSVVTSGTISATGFTGPLTGNASTATKLAATKNINGIAFDGSADITIAANSNTLTGTTLASNVTASSLTSVGTITSGVWSATTIDIAKGGTGATTAADALTNLGAEASANKSTDITADAASTSKYPSVKLIKDYVDGRVASAGVSDGSITNVKLANSTTILGSTTMTLGGTVSSVTGLTSLAATNLTGTLSGTATALATGRTISTTGDVTYTSGAFNGSTDVTGVATLAASGVSSGTYGSSTAIPVLTVDTKGRVTSASTVGITAGVSSLNYTSSTSYASGGTISGTTLTLAAADATNPGLISTGAQTITGVKTFSGTLSATANYQFLYGVDINPTFVNGSFTEVGNYGLRVQGVGIGTGGGNKTENTVLGNAALKINSSGTKNTAIGNQALLLNTTGANNTAVGFNAANASLVANNITAIGTEALLTNTGSANTAVGSSALNRNTTGINNTAVGTGSNAWNQTGSNNVAVGYYALLSNTSNSFSDNTAVGNQSMQNNLSGANNNTALGSKSLFNNTAGTDNVALGYTAGQYFGAGTSALTNSTQSIFVGSNVRAGTNSSTNEVVIGYGAIGNGSNTVTIGNSSTTANFFKGSINLTGNVNGGTWSGTTIGSNYGGAGTVNGLLKANGSGVVSAAVAGTDYQAPLTAGTDYQTPLTAGSGISLSSGTISVTGLTTSNLASNAGITNAQLTNSTTTLGSTTMTLGGTVTSVTGLTSVTSTGFTGALTGNASTATKLAATKNINGVAFDGSADITVAADANTLTGTTLASNVVTSSLTSVGTITSGVWSGTAIANNKLANSTTILGSTTMTLGGTVTSVTGLTSLTATTVVGSLSGTATTATNIAGGLIGSIPYQTGAGTTALLAGNTTSTVKYLASSGNGTNSTAPTWVTPSFVPYTGAISAVDLGAYDLTVNGITVGRGNTGDGTNTAFGASALLTNTTGVNNTAVGNNALKMTNGDGTTGSYNVALGYSTLSANTTGSFNVASGANTLASNTSGNKNSAFGNQSLRMNTTGGNNVGFGFSSLYSVTTASDNTAIGTLTGYGITTGARNTLLGSYAGAYFSTGNTSADNNTTGLNSVFIGYDVRPLANGDDNEIVISGYNGTPGTTPGTIGWGSNTTTIGNTKTLQSRLYGALTVVPNSAATATNGASSTIAAQNAGTGGTNSGGSINITAGNGNSTGNGGNITLTPGTSTTAANNGKVIISGGDMTVNGLTVGRGLANISTNTVLGASSLSAATSSSADNTAVGNYALGLLTSGTGNTAVGSLALNYMSTLTANSAFGYQAGQAITSGGTNTIMGYQTMNNIGTGTSNTVIGALAMQGCCGAAGTASNNTIVGASSFLYNTSGSKNVMLGMNAGKYYGGGQNSNQNTGTNNGVYIGYDVRPSSGTTTNEIVIAGYDNSNYGYVGNGSNTVTIGNTANTANYLRGTVNVNTGTLTATQAVNVVGSVNDFLEFNIQNKTAGTGAQAGINAMNDIGTDAINFAWMGINSSTFNNPQTYNIGGANDVSFLGAGNDMYVANASNTKSIIFSTGIATTPYFSEKMRITATGNVGIGTASPTALLEVNGTTKINGAATFSSTVAITTGAAAGKVLTSDASGNATWQNSGGSITTLSATGTATSTATYIIFTGSTASQTITVPSAVTLGAGREITIKNVASVTVSIASAGGYLIQDNSTLTATGAALGIEPSNNWMKLVSDGTNWYIMRALF